MELKHPLIVKTTILLDDMADFAKVNEIYKEFFGDGRVPARSTFVAKALPKGAKVEIDWEENDGNGWEEDDGNGLERLVGSRNRYGRDISYGN